MILVIIDGENGKFFILEWERFQKLLVGHYKDYLAKHGGMRPRNPESLHCAIEESILHPYNEKWDTIENKLK